MIKKVKNWIKFITANLLMQNFVALLPSLEVHLYFKYIKKGLDYEKNFNNNFYTHFNNLNCTV